MLKTISLGIAVAAFALAGSPLRAQQQEASLLKVDIPGQGFNLVFAMAKPGGARSDLRGMPDPLVIYSGDGELAFAIDDKTLDMFKDVNVLYAPACTFRATSATGKVTPISVYVVPKSEQPGAVQMASLDPPQPEPFMHKVEVPGTGLDIAYSTTGTPVAVSTGEPSGSAVYPAGGEFAMALDGGKSEMWVERRLKEDPDFPKPIRIGRDCWGLFGVSGFLPASGIECGRLGGPRG